MSGTTTATVSAHSHLDGRVRDEPGDSSHPTMPGTGGHTGRSTLHERFPSLVCVSLLRGGVSPGVWSRRGPWGVAVAPPILPYTGPGWSPPICRVPLELRSVFYVLLCDIPPVFMAIIWSVSLTPACPLRVIPIRGCSLDTCEASDWLDLLSSSSLFQDSVICADLWSRQSGPDASCDRHSVALALSSSLTVVMTPCYCGMLGGFHVLVGSLTYPSPGRMFEPSCFGRLQCLEAGLTSRPLLALPGLCLMPDL